MKVYFYFLSCFLWNGKMADNKFSNFLYATSEFEIERCLISLAAKFTQICNYILTKENIDRKSQQLSNSRFGIEILNQFWAYSENIELLMLYKTAILEKRCPKRIEFRVTPNINMQMTNMQFYTHTCIMPEFKTSINMNINAGIATIWELVLKRYMNNT